MSILCRQSSDASLFPSHSKVGECRSVSCLPVSLSPSLPVSNLSSVNDGPSPSGDSLCAKPPISITHLYSGCSKGLGISASVRVQTSSTVPGTKMVG